MPEQLLGICQPQKGLLHVSWRSDLHSLRGVNPFTGIHVIPGNMRICKLQAGKNNRELKFPALVFFCTAKPGRKPAVTNGQLKYGVITAGCSATQTCLSR